MITLEQRIEYIEKYLASQDKDFNNYRPEFFNLHNGGRQDHLSRLKDVPEESKGIKFEDLVNEKLRRIT